MKKLLLLLPLIFLPAPVMAQQVNRYGVCTEYREVYTPGGYDSYGNYYSGGVHTERYNVPCNNTTSYKSNPSQYRNKSKSCATGAIGAIMGGIAGYSASPRVADRWYMIPLGVFGGNAVGNVLCD